jgi:hypothetical protein
MQLSGLHRTILQRRRVEKAQACDALLGELALRGQQGHRCYPVDFFTHPSAGQAALADTDQVVYNGHGRGSGQSAQPPLGHAK